MTRAWPALAALLSLLTFAADAAAAVSPPGCWKGSAGCRHSSSYYWRLTGFTGSGAVIATRPKHLTCADVASGAREEIVAGRYSVRFTLRRGTKAPRIDSDSKGRPRTLVPLRLRFAVESTTHEVVRVLTPNADGSGCTETMRDCRKAEPSTAGDRMRVSTRGHTVNQVMQGSFVNEAFLECARSASTPSLLPTKPITGPYLDQATALRHFQHRNTFVPWERQEQLGTGETTVAAKGRLAYARWVHACTYYDGGAKRCRDARG